MIDDLSLMIVVSTLTRSMRTHWNACNDRQSVKGKQGSQYLVHSYV